MPSTRTRCSHSSSPDADRRRRRLLWFFTAASRLGLAYGELHVLEQGAGAAIWLEPQNTDLGPAALVRSGLALAPVRLGPAAFRRFVSLTTAFESARAEVVDDPYWHLFILGVAPEHQGRGLGGLLVAPLLARADAAGQPCYLETTEERNLGFYRGHGFEVTSERAKPPLPRFWTMVRQPSRRSSSSASSAAGTRSCSSVSRSRTVTVPSSIVWPSTVTP